MSKVIFVGNGYSGKKFEMGEVIDSYDIVVRFGWYDTSLENEKYLGSKTTCWATSIFDPVRAKQKHDFLFQHTWTGSRYDEVYKKLREVKDEQGCHIYRNFDRLQLDIENYLLFVQNKVRKFQLDETEAQKWSSMATFAWLLTHEGGEHGGGWGEYRVGDCELALVEKIDVYNIDWWDMRAGCISIDGPKVGRLWSPIWELRFFDLLWQEGKIHDLNPESDFHNPPRV